MKYTLVSLLALVSVAFGLAVSQEEHNDFIKRQANTVGTEVPVNEAAMTDADGNIKPFDSKNVYLDSVARGL